jgi:hypothetical protein
MIDRAEITSLLEIARETLRTEIAPGLDGQGRYTAAMIGNAMAIAGRASIEGEAAASAELAALRRLFGVRAGGDLDDLRRRLAEEIRQGRFDGVAGRPVRAVLRARVEARLAISNPDYRG